MSFVPPYGPSQLMLEAPRSPVLALPAGSLPDPGCAVSEGDLLEQMSAELDGVEAALARLDDGSFDSCAVCGSRIGSDRLLENPLLTRCPAHT